MKDRKPSRYLVKPDPPTQVGPKNPYDSTESIMKSRSDAAAINPGPRPKILAICAVDLMAWKLLRPWFLGLKKAGYEVHIACAKSQYFDLLEADGFHLHEVPIRRVMNPLVHIGPLWALYRLIRQYDFAAVNTHSPVAAVLGRMAAALAGMKVIVYTVHGFYFHDDMPRFKRWPFITLEWLLGRITNYFMFVSDEDRQTAVRVGIARDPEKAITIYNGVDLDAYPPGGAASRIGAELRSELNIPDSATVVGIVGRVVREKGYMEFAEMARLVSANRSDIYFLVVGDALPSDRDGIVAELRERVEKDGLSDKFRFTGFSDRVPDYLQTMDIFVLPSYREGFPRSVLEAMSTALPVVTTTIRGCREAVVDGETGLLVSPRNSTALADAVSRLLVKGLARKMGAAGRERAVRLYSQQNVQKQFVEVISTALRKSGTSIACEE